MFYWPLCNTNSLKQRFFPPAYSWSCDTSASSSHLLLFFVLMGFRFHGFFSLNLFPKYRGHAQSLWPCYLTNTSILLELPIQERFAQWKPNAFFMLPFETVVISWKPNISFENRPVQTSKPKGIFIIDFQSKKNLRRRYEELIWALFWSC